MSKLSPWPILCFLQWVLLWRIGVDWLTSPVEPYPYSDALATTALLGFGLFRWKAEAFRPILAFVGFCCLFLVQRGEGVWWAIPSVLILLQRRLTLARDLVVVCAAAVWLWAVVPRSFPSGIDAWIGGGFGMHRSDPSLAGELGLLCASILAILPPTIALTSIPILRSRSIEEAWPLAVAVSLLGGLGLASAIGGICLLGLSSLPGTVVFAASLALVSSARPRGEPSAKIGTLSKRRIMPIVLGVSGAFVVLILIPLAIAFHTVDVHLAKPKAAGYIPLEQIAPNVQTLTVAMEDGRFYRHGGFDFIAMHRALRVDLREGRVAQGGSTITQQLAKNLFLSPARTFLRKIPEAYLAIALEARLSKRQILEEYLNTIDYGLGRRGIRAAVEGYFHKDPAAMTLAESAVLVSLPPAPPTDELRSDRIEVWRSQALDRLAFFFPDACTGQEMARARALPLNHLVYPLKDAWDRHATETFPPKWHGVAFYFDLAPEYPESVGGMHALLQKRLAAFVVAARDRYGLTGLDHIGVYNDRLARGSQTALSAHAFGQAIDISGFRFAKDHLRVEDRRNPKQVERLLKLEAMLRRTFDVVVDWRSDPVRHNNHFHAEVKGPRQFPWREP